jgi:hypothetical protein
MPKLAYLIFTVCLCFSLPAFANEELREIYESSGVKRLTQELSAKFEADNKFLKETDPASLPPGALENLQKATDLDLIDADVYSRFSKNIQQEYKATILEWVRSSINQKIQEGWNSVKTTEIPQPSQVRQDLIERIYAANKYEADLDAEFGFKKNAYGALAMLSDVIKEKVKRIEEEEKQLRAKKHSEKIPELLKATNTLTDEELTKYADFLTSKEGKNLVDSIVNSTTAVLNDRFMKIQKVTFSMFNMQVPTVK